MITLRLKQGSSEWLKARLDYFTASEAPAMMGDSKYMSRNDLLKLKKTGNSKPISESQQRIFNKGHETEELARSIIEETVDEDLYQVTGLLENSKLLASFDGLSMLNDIVFEHKLWNKTLAENVKNNVLEPHYYWQLEQQLLVSGAKQVIFVTSDGTKENMEKMFYISQPERREALISGWHQFDKDLVEYQVEVVKESVVANKTETFPLVTYKVTGAEISSNITDCLDIITQRSQYEIDRVLETDQDFADKDQLNKATKKARSDLKTMVKEVQGKFVSYAEFANIAVQIDSVLQKMQSHGERQVKEAKQAKKDKIEFEAESQISAHTKKINKEIKPILLSSLIADEMPDFRSAMKNKRTIESIQSTADDVVAKFKIDADKIANKVKENLLTMRELASDHRFLFSDTNQLVTKDNEDLVAIIKTRIADHKKAEEEKVEALREKIRVEEEVKAKKKIRIEQDAKEQKDLTDDPYTSNDPHAGERKIANDIALEFAQESAVVRETEDHAVDLESQYPKLPPVYELVKGFLEWSVNDEETVINFGYFLVPSDQQNEEEAVSFIKEAFNTYRKGE